MNRGWPGPALPGNRWDLAPDPVAAPSVSVVVTHFEQPGALARTLHALARQTHPADRLEVLVSDDGSREAPAVPPGVRLVRQPDEGFRAARARNQGARAATGDVLVFLDADTTPEPGFVAAISRLPGVLPEAVVVGRRRHADLAGVPVGADVAGVGPARELTEPEWLRRGHRDAGDLLDADETSFRFVISAVLATSATMFAATGGFDETFTTYGGEDWEWAHRAWTHGALLAHEPAAVAWHDGPDAADRPGGTDRARRLAENVAVAARVPVPGVAPAGLRTPGAPDPLVTVPADLAGDALVLTVDSLLAGWPRAQVLLTAAQRALLPDDPRLGVRPAEGDDLLAAPAARSAWRRLDVRRAVTGRPAAWTAGASLLAGPGAPGRVEVALGDGTPAATWTSLRAERRAARWGRTDLDPTATCGSDLQALGDDVTAQARWGGWA